MKWTLILLMWSATASAAPACLAPNIAFWKKVFTEYTEDTVIFHDSTSFDIYIAAQIPKDDSESVREMLDKFENSLNSEQLDSLRVQRGVKERFAEGRKRSSRYIKMIERTFRKEGVPDHIKYLPHVESSFDPNAGSKVGAQGMWQIMRSTARLYGVKNMSLLKNPEYATKIAAKILLNNYRLLGDWDLAVNAYHSGPGNIMRAIEQTGSRDICVILREYNGRSFRFASKNYLGQFYAAIEIMQEKKQEKKGKNNVRSSVRSKGHKAKHGS